MNDMNAMHYAAHRLHQRNWSVFPLEPGQKTPPPGFALKQYQRERRASASEIAAWWTKQADYNIGLATGQISGFFVVDCDSEEAFDAVKARGIPETLTALTARGVHLYFEMPDFMVGCKKAILPGVDIRGNGGYVVAPPSKHPSGARYMWADGPDKPAPAPSWLLDMLKSARQEVLDRHVKDNRDLATEISAAFDREKKRAMTARQGQEIRDPGAYVAAAFDRELRKLENAPEGERNNTLNEVGFNLGQLVVQGLATTFNVRQALDEAATRIGLSENEIEATLRSGIEAGKASPRGLKTRQEPRPEGRQEEKREREPNLTEMGNADRLVKRWGDRLRYFPVKGKWFIWDSTRWQVDETGAVMRAAKDTIMAMYKHAPKIASEERRKEYLRWAMASESRNRLTAMVSLAAFDKRIVVRANDLDRNPWLLACRNATVDLKTGIARDSDPNDMITRRIEITYDAKAKAPVWERFLRRIMGNDEEMIEFLQRAVGYSLTGDVSEQCMFFLFGYGRNGKSTFIETVLRLLGEYAIKTPTETIMARDGKGATNDIARLYGMRVVVSKETDEGQRLAEATVKDLTGGDKITARFLYQEFFEFRPTHKLWMYGNHKPIVRGGDFGIWRRIRLIPFAVTIPPEERDPSLMFRLEDEMPGILNWAVQGCLKWQKSGLGDPKIVQQATAEYREEMDVIGAFIAEVCATAPTARIPVGDLYSAYRNWCDDQGERAMSKRALGLRLKERGFGQWTNGVVRFWEGIQIRKVQTKTEEVPF